MCTIIEGKQAQCPEPQIKLLNRCYCIQAKIVMEFHIVDLFLLQMYNDGRNLKENMQEDIYIQLDQYRQLCVTEIKKKWSAWVAQLVKHLPSAQIMILGSWNQA